jgi:CRP/FNR family cyclic AMP-dependent transcriptional regulator
MPVMIVLLTIKPVKYLSMTDLINIDVLLAWGAAYKKVAAGEIIFKEGQTCSFYYQLVSGKVKWVNIDDEGKNCIHLIVEAGESFGEFPLFDDGPFAATAVADEDCVIIRLHKPTFLQLIRENPAIHFAVTQVLSKRLRYKFAIIKSFAAHCPEEMIATLLNQLKSEKKSFCGDCNQLNLTRQQIADMTGLRVETVIRTMRTMHEKGDLVINRGKVYCKDMIQRITA